MMMLEDITTIEFAKISDAIEISLISRNDIEYNLGWRYTPEKINKLIKSNEYNVVVCKVNERIAGFGVMQYMYEQANLTLLGVKFNYRRKGLGTKIVNWLEKVAETGDIVNIFVEVREQNENAIKFYNSVGFTKIDCVEGYYSGIENGIILSKKIKNMFNI